MYACLVCLVLDSDMSRMDELSQPEQTCNLEQALSLNVFFCNANYPSYLKQY